MRIVYIAAGAGGSYCGACARDVALVSGLIDRGHEVAMLPLYTPLTVDEDDPSTDRVFYGGINAYLEQHSAAFRRAPRFLHRLLDGRRLLRLVSKNAVETRPEHLGAMTVSVLRGPAGRQAVELDDLVAFLRAHHRPDVVNLTNSLLSGLAPTIRARLGVPVVCTLQGEESFIHRLGDPYRDEAVALLRENARAIERFIAPADGYAGEMADLLDVDRGRIDVIRSGLDVDTYCPGDAPRAEPFRIGYLSRLSPAKGIDVLVEAYRLLAARRSERIVLAVAGQALGPNRRLWRRLTRALRRDRLADRVEYLGPVTRDEKIGFLRRCHVFSVPSRYPERRAVAALEAMACGVPVVLPRRDGYDELLDLTGGGIAVAPDDPAALAVGIERLLDNRDEADRLGRAGRAAVSEHFAANQMVDQTFNVYRRVIETAGDRRASDE